MNHEPVVLASSYQNDSTSDTTYTPSWKLLSNDSRNRFARIVVLKSQNMYAMSPSIISNDSATYPCTQEFHRFRLVDPDKLPHSQGAAGVTVPESSKPSPFTEVESWQLWGTGK